jgi:hypothetical protein
MGPYSRIDADIDMDEEAELLRLEAGDPSYQEEEGGETPTPRPPSPARALSGDTLLFRCAASHQWAVKDAPTGGQLRLFPDRVEFAAHGAAPSVVLPLAGVTAFKQSKPAAGAVMAKVRTPNQGFFLASPLSSTEAAHPSFYPPVPAHSPSCRSSAQRVEEAYAHPSPLAHPAPQVVLANGSSHVFRFEQLSERQRFHETFAPLQAGAQAGMQAGARPSAPAAPAGRPGPSSAPQQRPPPPASRPPSAPAGSTPGRAAPTPAGLSAPSLHAGLSPADAAAAEARLASDPLLRSSFDSMVLSGVLSPAQFWASRRHLLKAQRVGFSSQRGNEEDEPRPGPAGNTGGGAADPAGRGNTGGGALDPAGRVAFTLTPGMMARIFAQYPGVHRSFLDNVPHNVSEFDFWHRYFRAQVGRYNGEGCA